MTAEALATENMRLLATVGSTLFGTSVDGSSDHDVMGICIEPSEYVIGTRNFEQWEMGKRTDGTRAEPGQMEGTVYSLRKYIGLALKGNPTVLSLLFVPDEHVLINQGYMAEQLRAMAPSIISKRAAGAFLGYMQQQRQAIEGKRAKHTNRPELIEKYGFDTKFAMHMVRLGLQGVEFLSTGKMTFPVAEPMGQWLRDLRVGKVSKEDALHHATYLEAQLLELKSSSPLPDLPDYDRVNSWLIQSHFEHWGVM